MSYELGIMSGEWENVQMCKCANVQMQMRK
jgi:hypothetical protein